MLSSCYLRKRWHHPFNKSLRTRVRVFTPVFALSFASTYALVLFHLLCKLVIFTFSGLSSWYCWIFSSYICFSALWSSLHLFLSLLIALIFFHSLSSIALTWEKNATIELFLLRFCASFLCRKWSFGLLRDLNLKVLHNLIALWIKLFWSSRSLLNSQSSIRKFGCVQWT